MTLSLLIVFVLEIMKGSFINCQISKNFLRMSTRPAPVVELFRIETKTPEHCIYACVANKACQALFYPDPGSICVAYKGNDTEGTVLQTGTTALQLSSKFTAKSVILTYMYVFRRVSTVTTCLSIVRRQETETNTMVK
jgi:hypothetical protein